MTQPVRRVALVCVVLFLALLANANYWQVIDAKSLHDRPTNTRSLLNDYDRQRGPIVVGTREVARSVATNDRLKYLRTYPAGPEYAAATGFFSYVVGGSGIESAINDVLSGNDDRLFASRLSDVFTGRKPQGGAAVLTINPDAQDAAWRGLRGKTGAVVALDPTTGAILALVSTPSYDPGRLTGHDSGTIERNWKALNADPSKPLLDRALAQTYPPGSLFKVVTSAEALSRDYRPDTVIPAPDELALPLTTHRMQNFGGERCSPTETMTLSDALRVSCNTAFGDLGLTLGAETIRRTAERFDFNDPDLRVPMRVATSVFPANLNAPQTALSAIGQYDVRITPLQAALIAAAVANDGVMMRPYLVDHTTAPDLSTLDRTKPDQLGRAMSAEVASELTQMMVDVVNNGTGSPARIDGVSVAGKTGTAQHGEGQPPHAWFMAFAPADHPKVVVAVLVEDGGSLGAEATGGRVAAPIARDVIEAVLGR